MSLFLSPALLAKDEWAHLNYSFIYSRINLPNGSSKLNANLSRRSGPSKAEIEELNKAGFDIEDTYPGLWIELPNLAPNFFVFVPYYENLPDFSIAGEIRVYQKVYPHSRLLKILKPEQLQGIENCGGLGDLIYKTSKTFDPYTAIGDVPAYLKDPELPTLSYRRNKGILGWYKVDPCNNKGLTYQTCKTAAENFGPGMYIEAIAVRPGQLIYYPDADPIQERWAEGGDLAIYTSSEAQGGIPSRILTPEEIREFAASGLTIGDLRDPKKLLQYDLKRPWRHYRMQILPTENKNATLTFASENKTAEIRIPNSILGRIANPYELLKDGELELALGKGVWVEESVGKWAYRKNSYLLKGSKLKRIFPRFRIQSKKVPKNKSALTVRWEDVNFFGQVNTRFIHSHFDPKGEAGAQVAPSYTYGSRKFDAESFIDYDRQRGPGIWLEIPDDFVGTYVFIPFDVGLPDLSRYARIRVYEEVIPAPRLIAELTGQDFRTRGFETADELAAFLRTRYPDQADPSRILGHVPIEIDNERFPIVFPLELKNGHLLFQWVGGDRPNLLHMAKQGGLPGYMIELPDIRPQRYIFYPSKEFMPDLSGLGRVRIYRPEDLQGEIDLKDIPKEILEVELPNNASWPRVSVDAWVTSQLKLYPSVDTLTSTLESTPPACDASLRLLPPGTGENHTPGSASPKN